MITLVDPNDGMNYDVTENEFKALYTLVADCLYNMGGESPKDIHDDALTWTGTPVLTESGHWTVAEARGTYGALDKKGFIYIENASRKYDDAWEDMVNGFVFDMFEPIWTDIMNNPNNYGMTEDEL